MYGLASKTDFESDKPNLTDNFIGESIQCWLQPPLVATPASRGVYFQKSTHCYFPDWPYIGHKILPKPWMSLSEHKIKAIFLHRTPDNP